MTPIQEIAAEGIEWIRSQDPSLAAELYVSRGEDRGIEMRDGALESIHRSVAEGMGLRLLAGDRMGFACSGRVDMEGLKALYLRVKGQLPYLEPDAMRCLPEPGGVDGIAADLESSLWDEDLFLKALDDVIPELRDAEAEARRADRRVAKVMRVGYGEARGETAIHNSRGVRSWERGTSASIGLSALAGEGAEVQVGSGHQACRKAADLDFTRVAREGAWRAAALLGARKLPSGRRSVVLDPWAAPEFIDLVSDLLCADSVQRGKSLLAGRMGAKIGSAFVTFRDDPRRRGGLATALYDDEGCPTRTKTMVERGVLAEFFYDATTARREGVQSNASAGRGSYRGLPSPSSSNFYLEPGTITREDLIAGTKDGILVLEIMGMHMADPISGEFSVGVSGLAISGGALGHPVKGAMISGNVLDLLARVDAVADDLTFYGGAGAPTFRIAHMTVA